MYHEVTYADERRRRLIIVIAIIAIVACLALVSHVAASFMGRAHESGARSLRESIASLATQTYAVEGAYPSTIWEIEERYGLSIRHDLYHVSYEWLGDNMPPSVVVVPRD